MQEWIDTVDTIIILLSIILWLLHINDHKNRTFFTLLLMLVVTGYGATTGSARWLVHIAIGLICLIKWRISKHEQQETRICQRDD